MRSNTSSREIISFEDQDYKVALRIRKDLLDLFAALEHIASKLKSLPVTSTHARVASNMQSSIVQYLQTHMFTLRLLPNISTARVSIQNNEYVKVLEMQIASTQQQIKDLTARRKFDDVRILNEALEELTIELDIAEAGDG
jgi:Rabenosyn Rab binding domain